MAAPMPTPPVPNLGFLSLLQEANGTLGGYLVTNTWGRPLEFRLSSAVQPNRVQQILYGDSLQAFLCGELIGKTLLEKSSTPVQMVLTDCPAALDLRLHADIPVALYRPGEQPIGLDNSLAEKNLYLHPHFPADVALLRDLLEKQANLDLGEPFQRIREAVQEARRLGVSTRSAAA